MENDMLQTIILHSITMMIADEIYADLKKLSPNCADIDIIKFAILSDFFIHFTDQKTGATQ